MPSYQLTLKQRLDLEREIDRRAVEAGLVAPTIKPQPPKPTAAQASVAARKERTLASLGPKVARAIRHQKRDAEWEKERSELQAKREQLESQGQLLSSHFPDFIFPSLASPLSLHFSFWPAAFMFLFFLYIGTLVSVSLSLLSRRRLRPSPLRAFSSEH